MECNSNYTIKKAGIYNLSVTMSQGCFIDFEKPVGVTIEDTESQGDSYTYKITVPDGINGTIITKVNGEPCDDYCISVNTGPACDCTNDITFTAVDLPATVQNNVTAMTYTSTCVTVTDVTVTEGGNWFTKTSHTGGKIVGNITQANPGPGTRTLKFSVSTSKDGETCPARTEQTSQKAPSCTPDDCTCYIVGTISYPSSSSTQATVSWPYSAITWTTASTCDVTSALTTTDTSSTTVTYPAATCSKYTQSGTITWAGKKACGDKSCSSSDVTLSWSVDQDKPAGCDCSCNDITVSDDLSYNYTEHPGALLGNIIFDSCVTDTGITWNWDGETPWISSTGYSQNTLTGNIESYGSFTTNRSVTISATGNTATQPVCSQSFTITQTKNTVSCVCEDLEVTDTLDYGARTTEVVNWTSSADWASDETGSSYAHIISYQIPADKASCFENVTIDIEPDEDTFDPDVFDITPTADGKGYRVYVKGEFDQDKEGFIYFNYTMSDGQSCRATGRNYIGVFYKAACNCDRIYENACIRKTAPVESITHFIIADGETNGCGYFSGYTSAEAALGITEINTDSDGKVYINADSCGEGSGGDIQIFFVNTVGGNRKCGDTKTVVRTANYVSCERFAKAVFGSLWGDMTYTHTDTVRSLGFIWKSGQEDVYEAMKYYAEHDLFKFNFDGGAYGEWVTSISANTEPNGGIYIQGLVKGDTGPGGRTGTVTVSLNATIAKKNYGVCDCTKTHVLSVKEEMKPTDDCKCKNYTEKTINLTTYASATSTSYISTKENCFKSGVSKYVLLDVNGNRLTDSDDYVEGRYVTVTNKPWLNVAIFANNYTFYQDEFYPVLYYKWDEATTSDREAVIYLVTNVDIENECKMKITIKQEALKEISCSDIPNKIKIEKPSESKAYTYESHFYTNIATFDQSIGGVSISGEVVNPTRDYWIDSIEQGEIYMSHLYANISANTSTVPIGMDFDGSTKSRSGEVKIYLVDSDGEKFVDKDGNICEGDNYEIWQDGFSGYCPACNDINVRNDITVDYTGFGDKQCPYSILNPDDVVPAFSGNSTQERKLFKVKVKSIYKHEDVDMRCFGLSAATNHTDVVSGSLWVDGPTRDGTSNDDIYIVKGKLKPIEEDVSPILIKLYIIKRGFNVRQDTICGGVNEFQEGHIKILKDINGECK